VKLFGDIKGLIIYIDDFLIHFPTVEGHNKILTLVLNRAKEVGLKFNKKSKLFQKQIKFIGHIFNGNGVTADPDKIKWINNMPSPKSVKELQRFMGMANYLGSFIDNLSSKIKHLRDLLKPDTDWQWQDIHEKEFQKLKIELTKGPVLTFFDFKKPITLSVDASKFAVGATILHGPNPILYASASLASKQENYAQLEKQLFVILFGCTKFHQYLYGLKILVETDHKPLCLYLQSRCTKFQERYKDSC